MVNKPFNFIERKHKQKNADYFKESETITRIYICVI